MRLKRIIFFAVSLLLYTGTGVSLLAQSNCGCTNCPQFMPDFFVGDFLINVAGATNNDLANPGQGICGVRLDFDHQYMGDLEITLTSPAGQEVTLMGPIGLFGGTDFATWDVGFVPCAENASPDPWQNPVWQNNEFQQAPYDYTGDYYPHSGCLEEFDSGPVNGTWTLTVTDAQALDVGVFLDFQIIFCDEDGINCNSNPCGVAGNLEYETIFCTGDTVTIDASGSTANTFQWGTTDGTIITGTNTPVIEVTSGGTYYLTVSDNGSCPEVLQAVVAEIVEVPEVQITQDVPMDCDNMTVVLDGTNTQYTDILYNWYEGNEEELDFYNATPLGSNPTLEVTEPGEYTLYVVNLDVACAGVATYEVTLDADYPEAQATVTGILNCVETEVMLNGSSNQNFNTFSWEGPDGFSSGLQNPSVTAPGIYTLTVTNDSGCTDEASVEVVAQTENPTVAVVASNDIDCTLTSATLDLQTEDTDLTYSWTGPNDFESTTQSPIVAAGGMYEVTVTAANGCTTTASVAVAQSTDLPDIAIEDPATLDCNNTFIDLVGTSLTEGVSYAWTGPNGFAAATAIASGATDAGIYSLVVTAANDCTQSMSVEVVSDFSEPIVVASTDTLFNCNINEVTLLSEGENIASVEWSGPNGFSANTPTTTTDMMGTYTLIATATNGCTSEQSVSTNSDLDMPVFSASSNGAISCENTMVDLQIATTDTDIVSYAWTGPNGFTSGVQNPSVSSGGTYQVVATSTNGCTETMSVVVNENSDLPDIEAFGATITCETSIVSLPSNSSFSDLQYAWSGPGGYASINMTADNIVEEGTYTLTVTAANGCTNVTTADVIADTDTPTIDVLTPDGTIIGCAVENVALEGVSTTENISLVWTFDGNPISGTTIQADQMGVYTLTATASNGCTETRTIDITEDATVPDINDALVPVLDCTGAQPISIVSSTQNLTYEWSGPDGFSSTEAMPLISDVGDYSVTITAENACTNTTDLVVTGDFNEPNISVAGDILDCSGNPAQLTGNSTTANVNYSWSGPNNYTSNEANPTVDVAGTYILTVTGANGCQSSASASIALDENRPNAVAITSGTDNVLDCNTTSVQIEGSSNTPNTTLQWVFPDDTTSETPNPMVSEAGIYTLIVTADNGCTSVSTVTIIDDYSVPQDLTTSGGILYCDPAETEILATSSSLGVGYAWTGPNGFSSTAQSPMVSEEGLYTVVATGANGCDTTATFLVETDYTTVTASFDAENITCLDPQTTIQTSADDADATYSWAGPSTFTATEQSPQVFAAGEYVVTITNSNTGCTSTETVLVESDDDVPMPNIVGANLSCTQTSANLLGSSSDANDILQWTGPGSFAATDQAIEVTQGGLYTLTATASNGCTNEATYEVTVDTLTPDVMAVGGVLTCSDQSVVLQGSSTTEDVSFEWSDNSSFSSSEAMPTVTAAGMYMLTVTAENGCTNTTTAFVTVDESIPSLSAQADTITCTQAEILIDAQASTPPGDSIAYTWLFENNVLNNNTLQQTAPQAGIYQLIGQNINSECADTLEVMVVADVTAPNAIIDATALEITCDVPSIELSGTNSSGEGTLSYSWYENQGNTLSETSNYTVTSGGEITLEIQDAANGCTQSTSIEITENTTNPTLELASIPTINCTEPIVDIDASASTADAPLDFVWLDQNDTPIGANDAVVQISQAGMYQLQIENTENGCVATTSFEVPIDTIQPHVAIQTPDTLTCLQEEIILDGSESDVGGIYNIEWSFPIGGVVDDGDGYNPTVAEAGVYTLQIENTENGCMAAATVTVTEDVEYPTAVASVAETIDCLNEEVTISSDGSSVGSEYTYTWSGLGITDSSLPNPTVSIAGVYELTVQNDINGCASTTTVEVLTNENIIQSISVLPQDEACADDNNGSISIQQVTGGTPPYLYALGDTPLSATAQYQNLAPGTYQIQVQDAAGCTWEEPIEILPATPVSLDLGEDLMVGLGQTVTLQAQSNINIDSIVWSLENLEGASPSFIPQNTMNITATIFDANNCTATDAITIQVDKSRPVYIPTAFSPNEDGINDIFYIQDGGVVANIRSFIVADRWGNIVHQRSDIQANDRAQGWDGFFRGKAMDTSVFVYYAEIEFIDGLVEVFKGDVSLMR